MKVIYEKLNIFQHNIIIVNEAKVGQVVTYDQNLPKNSGYQKDHLLTQDSLNQAAIKLAEKISPGENVKERLASDSRKVNKNNLSDYIDEKKSNLETKRYRTQRKQKVKRYVGAIQLVSHLMASKNQITVVLTSSKHEILDSSKNKKEAVEFRKKQANYLTQGKWGVMKALDMGIRQYAKIANQMDREFTKEGKFFVHKKR